MDRTAELHALRTTLATELLAIKGVTGVGSSSVALKVYLAEDSDDARRRVERVVGRHASGVPIDFVVSGEFTPL